MWHVAADRSLAVFVSSTTLLLLFVGSGVSFYLKRKENWKF
jgi:hypothetical protein